MFGVYCLVIGASIYSRGSGVAAGRSWISDSHGGRCLRHTPGECVERPLAGEVVNGIRYLSWQEEVIFVIDTALL